MLAWLALAFLAYVIVILNAEMGWQVELAKQGFNALLLLAFLFAFGDGLAAWAGRAASILWEAIPL